MFGLETNTRDIRRGALSGLAVDEAFLGYVEHGFLLRETLYAPRVVSVPGCDETLVD
jgi:hypothetical protein